MKPLELTELQLLLDRHGANAAHWPAHLRVAAQTRIADDPAAAALLAAAMRLQQTLDLLTEPALPAELMHRILASAPTARGSWLQTLRQFWQELGGYRLAGPVLACGLLAGMALPLLEDLTPVTGDTADLISVAQLGDEQWQITDLDTAP